MKKQLKNETTSDKKITRKQAIKKAGFTALTAATMLFLETKSSSAASNKPASSPDW